MTDTTRTYPTLEVASAMTGVMLAQTSTIARMHEITGVLAGHPVWTHELGNARMMQRVAEHARQQFPDMPTREEAEADWQAAAIKAVAAYGETVEVRAGALERDYGPVSSLAEIMERRA